MSDKLLVTNGMVRKKTSAKNKLTHRFSNLLNLLGKTIAARPLLWDFPGGIHPAEMKSQSNGSPLRTLPLPSQLILPVKQHLGTAGELIVTVGERVLRGQPLTCIPPLSPTKTRPLPVHAPTSGTVQAIAPHISAHPSGLSEICVILTPDGEDRWIEKQPWPDYQQQSPAALIERITQFGIAGLGGAGFPSGAKLQAAGQQIRTLIINAAECEPYITADDRLMRECAAELVQGIGILIYLLQPSQVLIGIEDNKPQAIACLQTALAASSPTDAPVSLRVIPTKYPSGGARQLTQILTGKQVPDGGRSSDIGVLMQNIGTVYAIKRAIIDGEPLTERVVTLTGNALRQPGNVWARLGTPVSHLLDSAGFVPQDPSLVIMGGPLMGFALADLAVPVIKTSNCLLAPSQDEMGALQPEKPCIRCSACADACPMQLLPQQLLAFSKGQQHDNAIAWRLDACIECGICAWVCPSNIPLVQHFRQQKAQIRDIALQNRRAAEAKARFNARQQRLEQEKQARATRHQQAAAQPDVQSAVMSIKKPPVSANPHGTTHNAAHNTITRLTALSPAPASQTADSRQAAINAALARVKARKAQQTSPDPAPLLTDFSAEHPAEPQTQPPVTTATQITTSPDKAADPRQAAVAAALERVRARKAQQAVPLSTSVINPAPSPSSSPQAAPASSPQAAPAEATPVTTAPNETTVDPRKAAVAAALERVRARKAQQAVPLSTSVINPVPSSSSSSSSSPQATPASSTQAAPAQAAPVTTAPNETTVDPRKAAVAAALERVRARKTQQAVPLSTSVTNPVPSSSSSSSLSPQASPASSPQAAPVTTAPNETTVDPRKAAVAAALERVRARKAQQAVPPSTTDPRPGTFQESTDK